MVEVKKMPDITKIGTRGIEQPRGGKISKIPTIGISTDQVKGYDGAEMPVTQPPGGFLTEKPKMQNQSSNDNLDDLRPTDSPDDTNYPKGDEDDANINDAGLGNEDVHDRFEEQKPD